MEDGVSITRKHKYVNALKTLKEAFSKKGNTFLEFSLMISQTNKRCEHQEMRMTMLKVKSSKFERTYGWKIEIPITRCKAIKGEDACTFSGSG